jgi:hypothetical protein
MKLKSILVLVIVMCFTVFTATAQTITSNQTGNQGGYFYTFWTDGGGSVSMTLGSGGQFSVQWSNCGNFVVGKGWNPGGSRSITWSGSASGSQYFGVYGWLQNPLIEYYIPRSGGSRVGTYTVNGTTWTLNTEQRVNKPSIEGTATFTQFFCSGGGQPIDMGGHISGWKSLGQSVGNHNYQVVAVEGWGGSSGSADVTVGGGTGGGTTTSAPTSPPASTNPPAQTNPPTGGGGGGALGCGTCIWYGTEYPLCCTTTSGWGWESNTSCISRNECERGGQTVIEGGGGTTTNAPTAAPTPAPTPIPTSPPASTNPPTGGGGGGALGCGTCIWYGTEYPLCCTTTSGWGWESNTSCISRNECERGGQTVIEGGGGGTATSAPVSPPASTNPPSSGGGSGATCSNGTTISVPFTQNGAGEFCWIASSIGNYINSWNLDVLEVNGVSFTNKYASPSNLPAKIDGNYYIYYKGSYSWSHFEAR